MLEVGIRTLSSKHGTGISNDYIEQMELIRRWMKGKIKSSLRETDNTSIYQYYSMAPFYYAEAKFVRRMQVGCSVMCVKESIEDYMASAPFPQFIKHLLAAYIRTFLNSLDYLVIDSEKTEERLRQEGIIHPYFYIIQGKGAKEALTAELWMEFYQRIAGAI